MIYLRKFDNHAAYEAAESSLVLPNVSLCVNENEVHYKPYVGPYNGHEYVDLGLPSGTLWATMNVGATGMTDYGNYYQYGKGDAQYAATSGQSDYTGTENPLALSADTAAIVMGGDWHMPTQAQFNELIDNTIYYTLTTIDGVNGGKFISKTDATKYVFFPAAGFYYNGNPDYVSREGFYWSSTPNDSSNAYFFHFANGDKGIPNFSRKSGMYVRGVVG